MNCIPKVYDPGLLASAATYFTFLGLPCLTGSSELLLPFDSAGRWHIPPWLHTSNGSSRCQGVTCIVCVRDSGNEKPSFLISSIDGNTVIPLCTPVDRTVSVSSTHSSDLKYMSAIQHYQPVHFVKKGFQSHRARKKKRKSAYTYLQGEIRRSRAPSAIHQGQSKNRIWSVSLNKSCPWHRTDHVREKTDPAAEVSLHRRIISPPRYVCDDDAVSSPRRSNRSRPGEDGSGGRNLTF